MKRQKLSNLQIATDALFQKEHQALAPILQAEIRIQNQLARLDGQVRQTRWDTNDTEGYRVTGTDILWHGWESNTRRQLNMELARVRSQKLAALDALRSAFGRQQAVTRLSDIETENRRRALQKKQIP
ncbi:hypothetical protein [Ruegeria lacuscaerulensis]|uniref:hypothetical protein n=1 Tax=Ruegeria lacuscaerulensis TaxID=55218 RepID=UPI00147F7CF2|nr:hypothetical protein [Ruegeria lacuscaerulensis]